MLDWPINEIPGYLRLVALPGRLAFHQWTPNRELRIRNESTGTMQIQDSAVTGTPKPPTSSSTMELKAKQPASSSGYPHVAWSAAEGGAVGYDARPDLRRPPLPPALALSYQLVRMALLTVIGLGLAGALAEIGLRLAGQRPEELNAVGLSAVVPNGWTGWRLRPNVTSGPEWGWTNSQGMHDQQTRYPIQREPGRARIAFLGSSVVYGIGYPFAQTMPVAAAAELTKLGYPAD